jgi:hypothetical protein
MGPTEGGTNDRGSMFLPGMDEAAADEQAKRSSEETGTRNPSMSADSNHLNLTNAGVPPVALTTPSNGTPHSAPAHTPDAAAPGTPPGDYVEPLWMRRSKLVIFVMACIYLGIILVILPWNDVWTQNALIRHYSALGDFAMNNFVRGGITGLGFVNIWLGIWEAVSYREHKR